MLLQTPTAGVSADRDNKRKGVTIPLSRLTKIALPALFIMILFVILAVSVNATYIPDNVGSLDDYARSQGWTYIEESGSWITNTGSVVTESPYTTPQLSEEELALPTIKLIDAIMHSDYLEDRIRNAMVCSSCEMQDSILTDGFEDFNGYGELVSRDDLIPALEAYAKENFNLKDEASLVGKVDFDFFSQIVSQPEIAQKAAERSLTEESALCLSSILQKSLESTSSGVLSGYIKVYSSSPNYRYIPYYDNGDTTYSRDELLIPLWVAGSALTTAEKNYCNSESDAFITPLGGVRKAPPSSAYNCHSYAHYIAGSMNDSWINNVDDVFDAALSLHPSHYVYVGNASDATTNAYVEYNTKVSSSSNATTYCHSGLVTSSSNGTVTGRSKWGVAGEYQHNYLDVPNDYKNYYLNGSTKVYYVDADFYNYTSHDIHRIYTGVNHHNSALNTHSFQYKYTCSICGLVTKTVTETIPCTGNPCVAPQGILHPEIM